MKRSFSILIAGALALGLLPGTAGAGAPKQTEEGTILLPAPFTDDSGCFAGLHRRGAILTQENNNGVIGWHFDVDPKTWKKKFKLEPSGGVGTVDMDILFYQEFGTPQQVVEDPGAAGAPASIGFQTREPGGEAGKVPPKFNKVIICIYGGQQYAGGGANFTYTAG
ncbi:MAG: hypothetical protein M3238_05310 [Actinomycetota bacterium]|nr:hypothetical protein [Actinomycetota bacterium]